MIFSNQARMARGIHGLSKVLPMPALPDPSTPGGRAGQPRNGLMAVSLVARPQGEWSAGPSSTPLDTPRHTGLPLIPPHLT
jgi:hypothetical protein